MRFLSNMKTKCKPGRDMSQKYYAPYMSDNESQSDYSSDSESDTSEESADLPQNRFRQFLAGGISLKTDEARQKFETASTQYSYINLTSSGPSGPLGKATEVVDTAKLPEPKFETNKNTTLIMINSRDRDTSVYIQPTDFYIRLPRTYKNITNIAITELKLLSSFYYFSPTKSNTGISILELGRTITENGVEVDNVIDTNIREGTYNANTLITELNLQLNATPIFADISGGRDAFINSFQVTGNYSLLFNQPGDSTFNSLTGKYDTGLSLANIISKYFYSASTNITNQFYSVDQAIVAYYYPVLKEMVLNPTQSGLLTLTTPALLVANTSGGIQASPSDSLTVTGEQPFDRIVYGFRGLSDVYVTAVINLPANQVVMDEYRQRNTYKYFLANKYVCSYDTNAGRFNIVAPSINTSINSDLNTVYSNALIQQITTGNNTVASYATLQTDVVNQTAAISDFYNFIHQNLTNSFAIDFGKYTRKFFTNLNNEILTHDASGVVGIFATALSASIIGNQIDSSTTLPADISGTWLNLTTRPAYNDYSSNIPLDTHGFVDISNASEFVEGYVDIPFSVTPLSYSQFKFKSRCRQTMSFMGLPRTPAQVIADASEAYILTTGMFDSTGFCLLDPSATENPTFYLYDISQSMFETADSMINDNTYLKYLRQQKPFITNAVQASDIFIPDNRQRIFFQMKTDKYITNITTSYAFDVKFRIDADVGQTFPTDFDVYMYRDRAAFMYDVSNALIPSLPYNPRPKNYFTISTATQGSTFIEIDIRVLGNNTYYFYVRAKSDNFGSFIIKPYCVLDSAYGVFYPIVNQIEDREMPYVSSIINRNPASVTSKFYTYDLSANYIAGYDSNKVSNDYLDYIIRTSDNETGYDPNNGGYYSFKKLSASSSNIGSNISTRDTNLWFYSNSSNTISFASTGTVSTYLSSSNISSFKLASTVSTTFKITNPFIASNIQNPEMIILPRETTARDTNGNFIYTTLPSVSTIKTYPVTSTIVQNQPVYASTAKTFLSTFGLSWSSITNTFNGSYDTNAQYTESSPSYPPLNTSPLYICDNPKSITYDCSYNPLPPDYVPTNSNTYAFGFDASGVTGFTFQVPYNKFCAIKEFVIKFAYINPAITEPFLQDGINQPSGDMQYYNNRVKYLYIYETTSILNIDPTTLSSISPLMVLQRSKITQIGSYSATATTLTLRNRNPEWGTYYTYDICGSPQALKPYPPFYKTDDTGILEPAPITNTFSALPINDDGTLGAFYALSFTKDTFTYGSSDKNLLVSYQNNYLLTKRNTPYLSNMYQIQLLDPLFTKPIVHLITKITYTNSQTQYDPSQDISRFGNGTIAGISGELADTQFFLYDDSLNRDQAVISNDTRYGSERIGDATKTSIDDSALWGQEKGTIYKAADGDSGYNFLSYINSAVIRQGNSNVINIRGYVPTAQFTSGLRIIGTNWTDFGVMTLQELVDDIDALVDGTVAMSVDSNGVISNEQVRFTNGNYYSRSYAISLVKFNNAFRVKKTFGLGTGSANYLGYSYDGTEVTNGFKLALSLYNTLYNGTVDSQTTVNFATTNSLTSLTNYVAIRYAGILPITFLKRSRLSDPIPFQIQWLSALKNTYKTAFDQWGLGWNLGFNKIDTVFATQQTASTFIRITDDYIYLRMNEEMDMNTIDISEKEYISQSQDTFGQSSRYFSKLLLNTFGNYTTTFVQSPKIFNPVLGKLDKLHFQLVDQAGTVLNNADCEFTVTLQIEESVDQLAKSGTLDTGTNKQIVSFSSASK